MKSLKASFRRRQAGFTLIEVLVAVALMGIISLGAAVSSGQLLNQTSHDRDYTLASHNTANALNWIGRDALMAQQITGWQGFPATTPLTLTWTTWDNTVYTANYTMSGATLIRTYTGGSGISRIVIADGISADPAKTYCTSNSTTLTFTITSSIGEGSKVIDVTRTRSIVCRPKL